MKWWSSFFLLVALNAGAATQVVVFRDGSRMEVLGVELREELALLTDLDGKLLSVPRDWIVTEAAPVTSAIDIRGFARDVSLSAVRAAEAYRASSLHDPAAAVVAAALIEGFAPERFVEIAAHAFDERAPSLEWHEILPRLESPLLQRMERLEREVRSEDRLLAYALFLEKNPPPSTRVELVQRLERATGASDIAVELQATIMKALLVGINESLSSPHRRVEPDVQSAVDRVRATLESRTRDQVLTSLLYNYREASEAELGEYVDFLESANGLALNQLILESILVAMEDASRRTTSILSARAKQLGKTRI